MNEVNGPPFATSVLTLSRLIGIIKTDTDLNYYTLLREYLYSNRDVSDSIDIIKRCAAYGIDDIFKVYNQIEIQRNYFIIIKHLAAYRDRHHCMFYDAHPLSLAAEYGLEAIILDLIENGANVNEVSTYTTAIYTAASKGHIGIVEKLIKSNAVVNRILPLNNSMLPLHEAIKKGHLEIVELLIAADANVNLHQGAFGTPLMFAAETVECDDTVEIMRLLLNNGADHRAKNIYNRKTALDIAESSGNIRMTKLLREVKEKYDAERSRKASIRYLNILMRNKTHMQLRRQKGVGLADNSTHDSAEGLIMKNKIQDLIILMYDLNGKLDNVLSRDLLENLEDYLNFTKPSSEHEIWSNADYPFIKDQIELDYQAAMKSLKPYHTEATMTAIESNQVSVLKELIEHEFKNTSIFTLIINAAEKNNLEIVELFLNSSLPLNRADFKLPNRYSALGFAVRNQNAAMVRLLLDAGAEPYVRVAPKYSNISTTYKEHFHSVLNYTENSDEIHARLQEAVLNPNRHLILNRLYSRARLYLGLVCGIALGLGLGLGSSHIYNPGVIIGLALMTAVVSTLVFSFLVFMQNRMRYGVNTEEHKACCKPLLNAQYGSVKQSEQHSPKNDKVTERLQGFQDHTISCNY